MNKETSKKNSILFKEFNLKFSILDIVSLVITIVSALIISIIASVWCVGLLYQTSILMSGGNFEILREYALMALSLFGLTLLSGIFEKRADEEQSIVRHLFRLSLIFLTSFMCFLLSYSIFSQFPPEWTEYRWVFGIVYIIAISSFIAPIVGLMFFLIRYYILKYILKKVCSRCGKKKSVIDFYKGELLKEGLYEVCSKCRHST